MEGVSVRLSVCLSVCLSIISTTVHPINLTLGRCIAEDPMKCSVECEVIWMRPSNLPVPNRHILNGHCTSNDKNDYELRVTRSYDDYEFVKGLGSS